MFFVLGKGKTSENQINNCKGFLNYLKICIGHFRKFFWLVNLIS